jgi:Na+/melibiose symporter-like transporter
MEKGTKEWLQYGSAIGLLLSGVVLTYIDYFASHNIHDNVLWYVAQCLVYAGSVFGVAMVMSTKFGEIKSYVKNEIEGKGGRRDEEH